MNAISAGEEFLAALTTLVELEFMSTPHVSSVRAPFVVFRYASSASPEAALLATEAIQGALAGRVASWELRKAGRNWLLATQRFLELEDSGRFRTYPEALDYLAAVDPGFTESAAADLRAIAKSISMTSWGQQSD